MSLYSPYQFLREDGTLLDPNLSLPLDASQQRLLYQHMVRLRTLDERMLTLQRQGRLSFYGAATGQEAAVIGSAAAMEAYDFVVPALREAGVLLYRGLPLQRYIDQLMGNARDVTQGRQMPCHPPGGPWRYATMSSCIGNQLPQVTGIAYGAKLAGKDEVCFGFLGEGAASEGDFHVALNFAGVYKVPAVFICQNNRWSISLPCEQQSAVPSVAKKGIAYGVESIAVDGNDIFAAYAAVKAAADKARRGEGPSLVELETYRVGAHTTSDDPTRYRDESITKLWKEQRDPIQRLKTFLIAQGIWSDTEDEAWHQEVVEEIRSAVLDGEQQPTPSLTSLVTDVFAETPWFLQEQLAELQNSK